MAALRKVPCKYVPCTKSRNDGCFERINKDLPDSLCNMTDARILPIQVYHKKAEVLVEKVSGHLHLQKSIN